MTLVLPAGSLMLVWQCGDFRWRERCVLSFVEGSEFILVTPDMQFYIENLRWVWISTWSWANLARYRITGPILPHRPTALDVPPYMICSFWPRLSQVDISGLITEGDRLAFLERARRGLPPMAPVPPSDGVVLGAGQPAFSAVVGTLYADFEGDAFSRSATVVCEAHSLTVATPLEQGLERVREVLGQLSLLDRGGDADDDQGRREGHEGGNDMDGDQDAGEGDEGDDDLGGIFLQQPDEVVVVGTDANGATSV
jgi:hypothetical protein